MTAPAIGLGEFKGILEMDEAMAEETAEEAGDIIVSLLEAFDGANVEAMVVALEEVLALARQQLEE